MNTKCPTTVCILQSSINCPWKWPSTFRRFKLAWLAVRWRSFVGWFWYLLLVGICWGPCWRFFYKSWNPNKNSKHRGDVEVKPGKLWKNTTGEAKNHPNSIETGESSTPNLHDFGFQNANVSGENKTQLFAGFLQKKRKKHGMGGF